MDLIVHRGTQQIGGGSCVEVRTRNTRIIFDVGIPIDADISQPKQSYRPKVEGLFHDCEHTNLVNAVFLTHTHPDHSEFIEVVHPQTPIFMSPGSLAVRNAFRLFLQKGENNSHPDIRVCSRDKLKIGDFTIEPVDVCHSAPESLAFIITAEGKTLVYTGDFRAHGRKGKLFDRFMKRCVSPDVLLIEGTHVGSERENRPVSETDLEEEIIKEIKANCRWPLLVNYSPLNLDRTVTFLRACIRTDTKLVIDLFTAFLWTQMKELGWKIPDITHRTFRFIFFKGHERALRSGGEANFLERLARQKVDIQNLREGEPKVVLFRPSHIFNYLHTHFEDVKLINSQWQGIYPGQERFYHRYEAYLKRNGIRKVQLHVSGHAHPEDLVRFADAAKPKVIVPIHTNHPEEYEKLFSKHLVRLLRDGEELSL